MVLELISHPFPGLRGTLEGLNLHLKHFVDEGTKHYITESKTDTPKFKVF